MYPIRSVLALDFQSSISKQYYMISNVTKVHMPWDFLLNIMFVL